MFNIIISVTLQGEKLYIEIEQRNVHNEVKNSQCEQLDFAERNTSHLKCNIFTGWRVLCVMSDKLIEWLKKHLKFHS